MTPLSMRLAIWKEGFGSCLTDNIAALVNAVGGCPSARCEYGKS
jgi:hypothetical protein